VPACLPALRDDDVHSRSGCSSRFLGTADRVHHKASGVMYRVDIAGGIAQQERDDSQTSGKRLIESTVLIGGENEVAGNGPLGERRRFAKDLSGVIGPPQRHAAQGTGIGDRGGQAGIGGHRSLDDRVFDSQQLAHRRVSSHRDGPPSGARGAR
jgi:hypothetical protein